MKCPCCGGTGEIDPKAPVDLSPLQFRIYDIVRRAKDGIPGPLLIDRVYAHYPDGGPLTASRSVYVQIRRMNERLAAVRERVASTGSVYRLLKI